MTITPDAKCNGDPMYKEELVVSQLAAFKEEALDLLSDCAGQFLMESDDGIIFHSFMSTEEALCEFLIKHGRMRVVAGRGFALVENGENK